MPGRQQTKGTCAYCGTEIAKNSVTKHLPVCLERRAAIEKAEEGIGNSETLYHLRVQDAYNKDFWLDLEMPGSKTLKDLDTYLRAIWLECVAEEDKWGVLCNEHAKTHLHNEYGEPIKLVNSPRMGMCGYTGSAEPPY